MSVLRIVYYATRDIYFTVSALFHNLHEEFERKVGELEAQVFNSSQLWGSFKQQSISDPAVFHHNSITSTQKPLLKHCRSLLLYYVSIDRISPLWTKKMPLTYAWATKFRSCWLPWRIFTRHFRIFPLDFFLHSLLDSHWDFIRSD